MQVMENSVESLFKSFHIKVAGQFTDEASDLFLTGVIRVEPREYDSG
ncbi:MAG: hypothetical protein BWY89_00877 [Bacteroidetes bacterium ADurb.BinA012]|nr:MAG: hypothetical protein BWY89_00877 [Bacteroidetes bacterium ADurb.BinA012]